MITTPQAAGQLPALSASGYNAPSGPGKTETIRAKEAGLCDAARAQFLAQKHHPSAR
jgi:hypothetical protein